MNHIIYCSEIDDKRNNKELINDTDNINDYFNQNNKGKHLMFTLIQHPICQLLIENKF